MIVYAEYNQSDIIRDTILDNERVIDRVLFAFDDLCCISEFFEYAIEVDEYLMEKP